MSGEVNGLYPTPVRVKLLLAIHQGFGRIYFEAGDAYDNATGVKVTERIRQMVAAEWIVAEKVDASTKLPGELAGRTYYRLTDLGRAALSKGQQR
jgi:hypothetical protein